MNQSFVGTEYACNSFDCGGGRLSQLVHAIIENFQGSVFLERLENGHCPFLIDPILYHWKFTTPIYSSSRLVERRTSSEITSPLFLVSRFLRMFRYFKCLLSRAVRQRIYAALSLIRLFSRFRCSNLASGSVKIASIFRSMLEIRLLEKSSLITSWLMLLMIWLKPSSVSLLFENWQLYTILVSFKPADIALIYLSPNFCPFRFIVLASPLFLTNPMQHGSTLSFSAVSRMSRVGSASTELENALIDCNFFLLSSLSNFL